MSLIRRIASGRALVAAVAAAAAAAVLLPATDAQAAATGTVHTTSGSALTIRSSASTSSARTGSVPSGRKITISCQKKGGSVSGRYGTSSWWDHTTYGGHTGYVSDAYVYTGSDGRVAKSCGSSSGGSGGSSASAKVKAVIAAAKSQTGKGYSYSWGGGGKSGPSYGICCSPSGYDDRHRYGYDCSGLTQYAFWKGAGIDIGGVTGTQITHGKELAWSKRKAGDLIFWFSSSGATDHVAIYLGDGKMVESAPPRGKYSVHVTGVYGSHAHVWRVIG